jgi:hypothetical protein
MDKKLMGPLFAGIWLLPLSVTQHVVIKTLKGNNNQIKKLKFTHVIKNKRDWEWEFKYIKTKYVMI